MSMLFWIDNTGTAQYSTNDMHHGLEVPPMDSKSPKRSTQPARSLYCDMRKHSSAWVTLSKRVAHLDPVVRSEWTRFRPGGRFFAVVPHGAQIAVGLINGIADHPTVVAVEAGLTTAGYLGQAVAAAVPMYPSHRWYHVSECNSSRC